MAVLIALLKILQWKFWVNDLTMEVYAGVLALFFLILGIWVTRKVSSPEIKEVVIEKEIKVETKTEVDAFKVQELGLTAREFEILQLISEGKTNKDIAEALFVTLSTIKTHVSNLYVKLDVKNRTQALAKAKEMSLLK